MLTAYFYHKITGLPLTDPAVTVSVTLANMNQDVKILDNVTMSASVSIPGAFRYLYNFDREIDYMAYYSCSDDNYGEKETQYFFPSNTGGGGGGSVNLSGVTGSISNLTKLVKEENEKLKKFIAEENEDTNSHIELVKTDISNKIDSVEFPETDMSKITESLGTLKMTLTKLSQFIRSEAEKEKNEEKKKMSQEYESKLSELVNKIEEMEDAYKELDLSIGTKESLIEDMEKTAKEIVDELEKEKENAKTLAKQDIISSLSE